MNAIEHAPRTLSDAQLLAMTVEQLNAGARSYRADLRYSRADLQRFAQLWNERRYSTTATLVSDDGAPVVVIVDLPRGQAPAR